MTYAIRTVARRDYAKAVSFAMEGMHFDALIPIEPLRRAYAWWFWYDELRKATQVIAAYDGDRLLGVLLARMRAGVARPLPLGARLAWRAMDVVVTLGNFEADYVRANRAMRADYLRDHRPDGEILFLTADPHAGVPGIGTALLNELACRESGKEVFLYTDSGCTWQFYERRGFVRYGERTVRTSRKGPELTCMLYARVLPAIKKPSIPRRLASRLFRRHPR
ncbi:GNAT family N-acetyltransferase [Bifidobacterium cuniculi]|nr:GNAT family N-acetyltransferase [Bifidobacterium cuniculi]